MTDPKPLASPRHPYLHLAEAFEDLRKLLGILNETADELAPVLRSATPPSVQQGSEHAQDTEPQHYINPIALDRAATQLAMVARAAEVLGGHVVALGTVMLEAGADEHLSVDDGNDG